MRRLHRGGLIGGVIVLALVLVAVPVGQNWFRKASEQASRSRAEKLGIACQLFARDDRSGRFPTHLEALVPDYLSPEVLEDCRYEAIDKQKGTGVRLDWLYFGNGFGDTHPPRVLMAAPQVFADNSGQQMRIYLTGDGQGHVATEEAYQKDLADTVRQIQEMLKRGRVVPVPLGTPSQEAK